MNTDGMDDRYPKMKCILTFEHYADALFVPLQRKTHSFFPDYYLA
jgi:hypothetical protein